MESTVQDSRAKEILTHMFGAENAFSTIEPGSIITLSPRASGACNASAHQLPLQEYFISIGKDVFVHRKHKANWL